jgi:hypothetical protein
MKWFGLVVFLLFLGLAGLCAAQDQDRATPYYEAANKLYSRKNYNRAVQYYNAAIQFNPDLWQAFQGLGNCSYAQGDKTQALSNYQKCLSLHPDNPGLSSFVKSLRVEIDKAQASSNNANSDADARKSFRSVSEMADEHFEICPSIGTALEVGGLGGLGFGIGGGGFFMLDSDFGIGALTHLYLFGFSETTTSTYITQTRTLGNETDTSSESDTSLELVPVIKLKFDGNGIRPYFIAGFGLALISVVVTDTYVYHNGPPFFPNTNSSSPESRILPILEGGGGVEITIYHDLSLFLEARADVILGDRGTSTYIPIESGLNFTL